ncbi:MAG: hypothetical protein AB4058_06670 [Microcystaceae cyanobacterium]
MAKKAIIDPHQDYTFSDYFKLKDEPEEIFAYFGYTWQVSSLSLPQTEQSLTRLEALKTRLTENLPYISLTSEMARREFLIAPVIMDLIYYTKAKVRVEYALKINEQLKGVIDYYLQTEQNNLILIEAKNSDLERGLVQLGVELIAVDLWSPVNQDQLYGAVSMGNIWQFSVLNRTEKRITQDLNLYRVPNDLEELMKILVGLMESS